MPNGVCQIVFHRVTQLVMRPALAFAKANAKVVVLCVHHLVLYNVRIIVCILHQFHLDVERVMRRVQPQIHLTMDRKRAHRVARQRVHMDQIQQVARHHVLLDAPQQPLVHALHVVRNAHLLAWIVVEVIV